MSTGGQELLRFHLTGRKALEARGPRAEPRLRSALLASYHDLSTLRYDYPLVLNDADEDQAFARSLSQVVNGILQEVAPRGSSGERLRAQVLGLEARIRALALDGHAGTLAELWELAAQELLSECDEDGVAVLEESLASARGALRIDGQVVDCDEAIPGVFLMSAWSAVHRERAGAAARKIGALMLGLSDVLRADYLKSADAHTPESLAGAMATGQHNTFDFEAMSRVLDREAPRSSLSASRRRRIGSVLSVLRSQRFFAGVDGVREAGSGSPYPFTFESCTRAGDAFRERIPEMIELVKAIAIAELELENRYSEETHDAFFEHFDESSLAPADLALFPSYLIFLRDKDLDAGEKVQLIEALSSGLPMKILVQASDLLEEASLGHGRLALGIRSQQPANMAVGLGGAYVLQSTSSNLFRVRERVIDGLKFPGPALFSLFSGSNENVPDLPPYLTGAAAMASRAFPSFCFDPAGGSDWATRFHVTDNVQPEAGWPVQRFSYEDGDLQRVTEDVAFTFVDFAACDRRYARHFQEVPVDDGDDVLVPVADYLATEEADASNRLPYVWMVDEDDVLRRLVVDGELIRAARRCAEMWRGLQELGGIDNSHARECVERERRIWEQEKERELEKLRAEPPAPEREVDRGSAEVKQAEAPMAPTVEAAEHEAPSPDEPYIETPRCTTCDECTQKNDRLFAYDENKQAYIANLDAGTFRDLVEAAELCQVCIIHPGAPRNADEPGLAELIERAAAFN